MTVSARVTDDLETYRRELTGYCYRMLGSGFDADDAVQETMLRAWQAQERFEGRSSVRVWLYRIATNVCLDMLRGRRRRALPMELGPAVDAVPAVLDLLPAGSWVSPIADERVLPVGADPAELFEARESVRLAFVAALQALPARQRAALILCDVLRWPAVEAAALLETSVAAVNSALQRARGVLPAARAAQPDLGKAERDLVARFVDAFQRYDIDTLVTLLHDDAIHAMPPYALWLRGADSIGRFLLGPGAECRGSRLVPTSANGAPAFGQYRPDPDGGHRPWSLQVLEVVDGRVAEIHAFLDTAELYPAFGLPDHLPPHR
ncbi:sigma-70 family RNA polymerase sigma factor [Luedemannella flava]|uniref:sigma-70 family RNA polymerase sigma factor n=1 Tax=Luedemannella flava TaxID=349316 RepID=UPI0031D2332B